MGELVAGDRDSYQYLVESIRRFPNQVLTSFHTPNHFPIIYLSHTKRFRGNLVLNFHDQSLDADMSNFSLSRELHFFSFYHDVNMLLARLLHNKQWSVNVGSFS